MSQYTNLTEDQFQTAFIEPLNQTSRGPFVSISREIVSTIPDGSDSKQSQSCQIELQHEGDEDYKFACIHETPSSESHLFKWKEIHGNTKSASTGQGTTIKEVADAVKQWINDIEN